MNLKGRPFRTFDVFKRMPISKQLKRCRYGKHCTCNPSPSDKKAYAHTVKVALKREAFKIESIAY